MFRKAIQIGIASLLICGVGFSFASPSSADERGPIWSANRNLKSSLSFVDSDGEEIDLPQRGGYLTPSDFEPVESTVRQARDGFSEHPVEAWPVDPAAGPAIPYATDLLTAPSSEPWTWQLLPTGIVYKSYLASQKESRFATEFNNIPEADDTFWEPTLGARVGLLRFGNTNPILPQGFQIDAEGSAQTRLNLTDNVDVTSVDFRGGVPLTYGYGPWRFKAGYYHISSHLGDEFLLKHPGYPRLNFARDTLIFGVSYYAMEDLRLYSEIGWAFFTDVSEPWEIQFGIDYAPTAPTGPRGAPFFAVNTHLREELDFSGNFTVQAGWAWRSAQNGSLLRVGAHYFNGASWQYSFYRRFEQQLGMGLWYDF